MPGKMPEFENMPNKILYARQVSKMPEMPKSGIEICHLAALLSELKSYSLRCQVLASGAGDALRSSIASSGGDIWRGK